MRPRSSAGWPPASSIYLAGSLGKTVPRSDAFAAAGTLLAGVVLLLGALYLEQSCRLPKDDDDDRDTEPSSQSPH